MIGGRGVGGGNSEAGKRRCIVRGCVPWRRHVGVGRQSVGWHNTARAAQPVYAKLPRGAVREDTVTRGSLLSVDT